MLQNKREKIESIPIHVKQFKEIMQHPKKDFHMKKKVLRKTSSGWK